MRSVCVPLNNGSNATMNNSMKQMCDLELNDTDYSSLKPMCEQDHRSETESIGQRSDTSKIPSISEMLHLGE